MYGSQLPDPILRIILVDYADIDFEDIIHEDTDADDFIDIYGIICPNNTELEYKNIIIACAKVGNYDLINHAIYYYGRELDNLFVFKCAKIASKYGQLSIFAMMMDKTNPEYRNTYLTTHTCYSLRQGHFHIVDWIIDNYGDEYIRSAIRYVFDDLPKLSVSRKIRRYYAKYIT